MSKKAPAGRRHFISTSLKSGLVIGLSMNSAGSFLQSCSTSKNPVSTAYATGFDQQPLPYAYTALEDVIDAMTMEIHYSKHAAAYSKNVKEAATAEGVDMSKPLEELLANISKYSIKMRNNGGGHYNHELFWQCMQPKQTGNAPVGKLQHLIDKTFGSFDAFKKQFTDAAKSRFGSGWAWLYFDETKNLKIGSTPNQDNPLMDVSEIKGFPNIQSQ